MSEQSPEAEDLDGRLIELLRATQSGDDSCRNELMRQLRSYLVCVANRELRQDRANHFAPSDVVQQSCLRVVERLELFQGDTEGEFRNWLKRVLANELNQARRRLKTQKRDVAREQPLATQGEESCGPAQLVDPFETPRTSALAQERREALNQAIARLPEEYRRVLELRNWQRLPFAQIATEMGKSVNATEKLWYRAVQRLHQEMSEFDEST